MIAVDAFFHIEEKELRGENALFRRLRQISVRHTHTSTLPWWYGSKPDVDKLADLLDSHGLTVLDKGKKQVLARQLHGREYTFTWSDGRWHYAATKDPTSGLRETKKSKSLKMSIFDSVEESRERSPSDVWWDGKTPLKGDYLAFDLETTLSWPGEFPQIVLGSAGTETGDAVLLLPEQLVTFFEVQHSYHREQIWCGWNIAEFDIPVMDFRVPHFRERVHDLMVDKLLRGYLYDTMKFVQLLDIAMFGEFYSRKTDSGDSLKGDDDTMLFPVWWGDGWGRKVYALGPQAKRFLGVDVPKEEQQTFWEYLGRAKEINTDQAAYALADGYLVAEIQKLLYESSVVRKIATKCSADLEAFDGVTIEGERSEYSELSALSSAKFGWQTHTIQFLGAYTLSWISANGISVDPTYCFDLIRSLEKDADRLMKRLSGSPGLSIRDKNGQEVAWCLVDERAEFENKYDPKVHSFVEIEPLVFYRSHNIGTTNVDKKLNFVKGRSLSEVDLQRYVTNVLWPRLDPALVGDITPDRLGLRTNNWLFFYDISNVDDIPDLVLRLTFQIKAIQKKIATVKTYLPNMHKFNANKMKKLPLDSLAVKLGLDKGDNFWRIYPGFRSLLATGRTGAFNPNVQQVERSNKFRACFVAATRRYYMAADYGAAEMGTQGEIYAHRYGKTVLVKYMNDGYDVHLLTAMQFRFPNKRDVWMPILSNEDARDLKRSTEYGDKSRLVNKLETLTTWFSPNLQDSGEDLAKDWWIELLARELMPDEDLKDAKGVIKKARQSAKVVNFGVPGGMRPPKILQLAKTDYGIRDMTLADAEAAYKAWMQLYPEGKEWIYDGRQNLVKNPPFPYKPYFDNCFTLTGRLRGYRVSSQNPEHDTGFNEWHNTQFQGLAADAAKVALYLTWREGLSQVNFVHDEIDFEVVQARAEEQRNLATKRMRQAMRNVTKYIDITVGSALTERWQK